MSDSSPSSASARRARKRAAPCDAAARGRFVAGLGAGLPAARAAAAAGCAISTFNKRRQADARFDRACTKAAASKGAAWAGRRPGPPTRCGAAAKLTFLVAVAEGIPLEEAAALGGCALETFYAHRRREPSFEAAWAGAAEWAVAHRPAGAAKPRRLRFDAARRARFLAALGEDCCTREAARRVPIDSSAVYKRLKRDPDFARANAATLEAGYERLGAAAVAERAAEAARMAAWREAIPTEVEPADFDTIMHLLAYYRRPAPRRRKGVRPRPAMTHFELVEALGERLDKVFGKGS
jgi:hypothetical protein